MHANPVLQDANLVMLEAHALLVQADTITLTHRMKHQQSVVLLPQHHQQDFQDIIIMVLFKNLNIKGAGACVACTG